MITPTHKANKVSVPLLMTYTNTRNNRYLNAAMYAITVSVDASHSTVMGLITHYKLANA
jgi:hypothetical protein